MKKIISLLIAFSVVLGVTSSALADDVGQPSIVMAINEENVIANGVTSVKTPPVMVLGKTYVDLYAIAPLMGIKVQWVEAYIGYFTVSANGKSFDFTLISEWDELTTEPHKFFVKDSKIFVSLRELNELTEYNLSYDNGIITLGKQCEFDKTIFGEIDLTNLNEYVYQAYPLVAEFVVNPYQEYDYNKMVADAEKLAEMYPDIVKLSSIGKSVEGRDLTLIEFGKGKNKIFVCGAHHGREYITTTYLMYAIDRYANCYRTGSMWGNFNPKDILNDATFYIVPMVNPDGVNLVINGIESTQNPEEVAKLPIFEGKQYGYSAWKANIRGVDLNWNYDKDWSVKKNKNVRGSSGFTGDGPYTEPESMAMADYVDNNYFDAYVSYHTQGEIFYWAEDDTKPTYINNLIKKETGFVQYTDNGKGIGGSFFDYVYRKYKKPTLTIELCPYIGNYPYPVNDFDTVWNPTKNILLIVANEIIYNNNK